MQPDHDLNFEKLSVPGIAWRSGTEVDKTRIVGGANNHYHYYPFADSCIPLRMSHTSTSTCLRKKSRRHHLTVNLFSGGRQEEHVPRLNKLKLERNDRFCEKSFK